MTVKNILLTANSDEFAVCKNLQKTCFLDEDHHIKLFHFVVQ